MSKDIFISYSTNDTDIAEKARDYLEENGLDCWMAPRDIKTSDNYAQEIMDALNEAKIVTLIFSKSSALRRTSVRRIPHRSRVPP